jgi:hypothetical protein
LLRQNGGWHRFANRRDSAAPAAIAYSVTGSAWPFREIRGKVQSGTTPMDRFSKQARKDRRCGEIAPSPEDVTQETGEANTGNCGIATTGKHAGKLS